MAQEVECLSSKHEVLSPKESNLPNLSVRQQDGEGVCHNIK
jgi:hypothetical protein